MSNKMIHFNKFVKLLLLALCSMPSCLAVQHIKLPPNEGSSSSSSSMREKATKGAPKGKKKPDEIIHKATLIREEEIASGTQFDGTTIGGLSAITYDNYRQVYYMLPDDPTGVNARFYTATLNLDVLHGDDIEEPVVNITTVTSLTRSDGSFFGDNDLHPEGLVYNPIQDTLILLSEGQPEAIYEFDMNGNLVFFFQTPAYYLATGSGTYGTRNGLGFEGLTLASDYKTLWAANENALIQDGPRASLTEGSPVRFLNFDIYTALPAGEEYVYMTDPIAVEPSPSDGFSNNGLTEIVSLDDDGKYFLVLERSYSSGSAGRGYNCRLYEASTIGATNVYGQLRLDMYDDEDAIIPMTKRLIYDFGNELQRYPVDNLEGLQLIYDYDNDYESAVLVIVSDDNFEAFGPQGNQFLFLHLEGEFY